MRIIRPRFPRCRLRQLAMVSLALLLQGAGAAGVPPKSFDDEEVRLAIVEAGAPPSRGIIYGLKVTERFRQEQEAATGERYLLLVSMLDVNCPDKVWRRRAYAAYGDEAGRQEVKVVPDYTGGWQAFSTPSRRALADHVCANVAMPAPPAILPRDDPKPGPAKDRRCWVTYTEEERPLFDNVCDYNTYGPINCRNVIIRRDVIRTPHVVCK